jgi:hypothetical protein
MMMTPRQTPALAAGPDSEPDSGPSDTATAHGHLRPQLSRAFRALYGSHNRKGIIFGLPVQVLVTPTKGNEIQRCWRLYELSCCASNGPDLLIRHASIISHS